MTLDGALLAAKTEDLRKVREYHVRMEEREAELKARDEALVAEISAARTRLALHPEIQKFLERRQSDANARTVGAYQKLLTALINDIFGTDHGSVRLELGTDRGAPALDIVIDVDGNSLDIFESKGGSLTNVICVGLRAIATVKSKVRPFLLLDEPDYWMEPDKVEPFFRVLKNLADRMKFQCLVVTHHDPRIFDFPFHHIELGGHPKSPGGTTISTRGGPPPWPDDETPGMRSIAFRNFAAFSDATLSLGPGMNIISGKNDLGKSRITRALRGIFYDARNESDDKDIRIGQVRAEVDVRFEGARVVYFSREKDRTPRCVWQIKDADGRVARMSDGTECEGGKLQKGESVPPWLMEATGIGLVGGHDLQIMHQKRNIFLLDKAPSVRASVLALGREAGWLGDMIQMHKDDVTRDNAVVRRGEPELSKIRDRLKALAPVADLAVSLTDLEAALAALKAGSASAEGALTTSRLVSRAKEGAAMARESVIVLGGLPPSEPSVEVQIREAGAASAAAATVMGARARLDACRAESEALSALPAAPPDLLDSGGPALAANALLVTASAVATVYAELDGLAALPHVEPCLPWDPAVAAGQAAALQAARVLSDDARKQKDEISGKVGEAAVEVAEALAAHGNECPLCGCLATAEAVLAHAGAVDLREAA